MAHGTIATVPIPIDMYKAVNAQVTEKMGEGAPTGLLAHSHVRQLTDSR